MLTEKYYGNFFMESTGGGFIPEVPDEPSEPETLAPGTVIIEEQTVTTLPNGICGQAVLDIDRTLSEALYQLPPELAISFNGALYKVPRIEIGEAFIYGNADLQTGPDFSEYPFAIIIEYPFAIISNVDWTLYTPEPGTYTISAKIPDGKGVHKIIKMGKPNTIANQVEEIIKSLGGTVDTKRRNLQNLISTLADMAENGEIGGGITPEGTLEINENGTFDVSEYASAEVDVDSGPIVTRGKVTVVNQTLTARHITFMDDNGLFAEPSVSDNAQIDVYAPLKLNGVIDMIVCEIHEIMGAANLNRIIPSIENGSVIMLRSDDNRRVAFWVTATAEQQQAGVVLTLGWDNS